MAWRLARSLESLRAQVNQIAPGRSKISDGSIGNAEHSARLSDHNPDGDGVVRALDLTDDPRGGLDALWLREALRESRDPRIKYLISEGQICSPRRVNAHPAWAWRPYTGPNGHFKHLHISVQPGAAGDRAGSWSLTRDFAAPVRPPTAYPDPVEDDMTPAQAAQLDYVSTQVKAVANLVVAQAAATNARVDYVQQQAKAIAQLVVDTGGADAERAAALLERINNLPDGVIDADALAASLTIVARPKES